MSEIKKYYLVEIHTNWADEMDIDGYKIYNEKEYSRWNKGWGNLEGDYVNVGVGTNEDVDVSFDDFDITELSEEQYLVFKKLDMVSFGHTNLFDAYEYYNEDNDWDEDEKDEEDDSYDEVDLEGEEWSCHDLSKYNNSNSHFVNAINNAMTGYYPTWEIPEEFKEKLVYIGRRYAILYIDEKIDTYNDERFLNALVEDVKVWNEEKKGWEYHIRLRSTQKPFYV